MPLGISIELQRARSTTAKKEALKRNQVEDSPGEKTGTEENFGTILLILSRRFPAPQGKGESGAGLVSISGVGRDPIY